MIRITKMSGKLYGYKLSEDADEFMEEVEGFVNQGTPVVIVESLEDLEQLDIYDDVIMVDRED